MPRKAKEKPPMELVREWALPAAATLGSAVRAKGIMLEVRARLPLKLRKSLDVVTNSLVLGMPTGSEREFESTSAMVSKALQGIESLDVIPREIEDILSISTTERHRWLKDGRLPSAGTRTVKLRGRARKITFHVFDPRRVEDMLDSDIISTWREDDAETARENRRKAAWKAKLARAKKAAPKPAADDGEQAPNLAGWDAFEREGLLR